MDRIEFQWWRVDRPADAFWPLPDDVVVAVVNGAPLGEQFDDEPFPGIELSRVADRHEWLGAEAERDQTWAVVLDGGCGEAECCGIYAKITQDADSVVWQDFWSNSSAQKLPTGLVLRFDRADYEAALERLRKGRPRLWDPQAD